MRFSDDIDYIGFGWGADPMFLVLGFGSRPRCGRRSSRSTTSRLACLGTIAETTRCWKLGHTAVLFTSSFAIHGPETLPEAHYDYTCKLDVDVSCLDSSFQKVRDPNMDPK